MAIAYKEFDDIFNESDGSPVAVAEHRANALGIQAEMEERLDHLVPTVPGVISGGACSVDDPDIDVAAIVAYAGGKRYEGSESLTFTVSDAADDYYVYIDPTDDTTPLTKGTTLPSGNELPLGLVTWNGTDTLSALVDLRAWGIFPVSFPFGVVGAVTADTIAHIVLPHDFWLETVKASLEDCGSGAGPTYIDVHGGAGGSEATVFTTQSRRITIAHDATNGAVVTSGVPDGTRLFTAGQKLLVIVDAVATDPVDLGGVIIGRRY
ncbi:MAG TPA: hypothetical protein VM487_15935 [Phycisphaerae bacterium]|nr:hypothetical protein [Phycisphaerae bacterium]